MTSSAFPVRLAMALASGAICASCVPAQSLRDQRAPMPVFDPIQFFAGRTHGSGTMFIVRRRPARTVVDSVGSIHPDGSITVDQDIHRGDLPVTHRQWLLRKVGPAHYAGTLSDASGPVTGEVVGNSLHLRFMMKGKLHAQQWLYVAADGRTVQNRLIVTKLGVRVASLHEVIQRVDP